MNCARRGYSPPEIGRDQIRGVAGKGISGAKGVRVGGDVNVEGLDRSGSLGKVSGALPEPLVLGAKKRTRSIGLSLAPRS